MKQITIVAEDKVGLIADISYILGKARINIETIMVEVYGGKAVINLTVKDEVKAARLLAANNYRVLESELLTFKVKDEPGKLAEVSKLLREAHVNTENLYQITHGNGFAINAIKVDKPKKARKLLAQYLVKG
ncbi:MAG: hypothetical protein WCT52_01135 [Candidatus Micrarchaeia archaeon]